MSEIEERLPHFYHGPDAKKEKMSSIFLAVGDFYYALDTKALYIWDGTAWNKPK